MNEYDELPRGDEPEFFPAEIVAQTNMRSLALAIRRELGEGYVITPGIDMLYAIRRLRAEHARHLRSLAFEVAVRIPQEVPMREGRSDG